MDKIAVVYESKYGSTKKYAQWIEDELKADLFEQSKVNAERLKEYETIIYGGGLYASGIAGISILTKNYERLKDKKIIVFTVGLASTEDKEIFEPILQKNFTKEMQENITFFHFRGAIDYSKIGMIHNMMMRVLKRSIAKKDQEELTEDDKEFLATYGEKVDYKDKNSIEPLLSFIEKSSS